MLRHAGNESMRCKADTADQSRLLRNACIMTAIHSADK